MSKTYTRAGVGSLVAASLFAVPGLPAGGTTVRAEPASGAAVGGLAGAPLGAVASSSCTPLGVAVAIENDLPWKSDNRIYTRGVIHQSPSWACTQAGGFHYGQSKHCGFFGCNWHVNADINGPANKTMWAAAVDQTCRSGTNHYRGLTRFKYQPLGSPQITVSAIGSERALTC